jgi:hypothetical protein
LVDVVEKSTGSGADDLIFSNINQDEINVETI